MSSNPSGKSVFNVSRNSAIRFLDGTTLPTDSAPSLGSLPGQLLDTQLPITIGAGTSLTNIDIGNF